MNRTYSNMQNIKHNRGQVEVQLLNVTQNRHMICEILTFLLCYDKKNSSFKYQTDLKYIKRQRIFAANKTDAYDNIQKYTVSSFVKKNLASRKKIHIYRYITSIYIYKYYINIYIYE